MDDADDLAFTPALQQAGMIRAGDVSPSELVDVYLDRIDRIDPQLGAYITVAHDAARAVARECERILRSSAPEELPPFLGVPISIKDVADVAGMRGTHGCAAWSDRVPETDAAVVAAIRRAGFVILGKTKTPEFSAGMFADSLAYGPCRNPWNLDYSSGGSSMGAAAGLAAGLCAISEGSDDGGSVRVPSAWCGVVGIKPTRGRVSAAPAPMTFEHTPGPIARTVADAAAMLDAISGYVTGDAFWAPPPARPFVAEAETPPGRLRIAMVVNDGPDRLVETFVVDNVRATGQLLEELGHEVEELDDWPGAAMFPDTRVMPLHAIYGARFAAMVDHGLVPAYDQLEPANQALVDLGRTFSASDLIMADLLAQDLGRRLVSMFDRCDVLLTPVRAVRPPLIGELRDHAQTAMQKLGSVGHFTAQFNVSGQPAISVPSGFDEIGLPLAVQLVGRPADEATIIRVAAQLEAARPWGDARPAVATTSG